MKNFMVRACASPWLAGGGPWIPQGRLPEKPLTTFENLMFPRCPLWDSTGGGCLQEADLTVSMKTLPFL